MMKQEKGITLVVLVLAIIIMVIISTTLIYNADTGIKTRNLNDMYNDIKLLKNKIDIYYAKNRYYTNFNCIYVFTRGHNKG